MWHRPWIWDRGPSPMPLPTTGPSTSLLRACSTSSARRTLITLRSGRSHEPATLPFQRRCVIRCVCFGSFWHHAAQHLARADSLRLVLLCHVRGRSLYGRLGDVAVATLR